MKFLLVLSVENRISHIPNHRCANKGTVHMQLVPIPTTGCLKNCLLLKNEYRDPHFLHIYSQLATQE